MASRIRQGDTVEVIAGTAKGNKGEVIKVLTKKNRVLVRGVNMAKRHTRPTQKNPQGGIVDQEASIHLSNVMVVDPKDGKPTRIRIENQDGKNVRIGTRTGTLIPSVVKTPAEA